MFLLSITFILYYVFSSEHVRVFPEHSEDVAYLRGVVSVCSAQENGSGTQVGSSTQATGPATGQREEYRYDQLEVILNNEVSEVIYLLT